MKKKLLLTGVGGYIGSITAYTFLQQEFEVIGIDNLSTGFRRPLELLQEKFGKKKFRFYTANLLDDLSFIFEEEKDISAVIHLAGYCSVDESIRDPKKYFTNNVSASQNLLAAMLRFNISHIVFSSTCAVYGEKAKKVTEKNSIKPINPYGESKKMTENMLQWYGKLNNLHYVTLRYFNVCGASVDGLFGDSKKPSTHLVQNTIRAALDIEPLLLTCPQVNTPDGTTIRDYVDVIDLARAQIQAVEYLLQGGKSEEINISGGNGISVLQVIKAVEGLTGKKISFTRSVSRKGEYSSMIASYDKAKKILNWSPNRSITESIQTLITWYRANPNGWGY